MNVSQGFPYRSKGNRIKSSPFPARMGTSEYEQTGSPVSMKRKRVRILESESSDEKTMFDKMIYIFIIN